MTNLTRYQQVRNRIRLRGVSDYGNNLYIDSIQLRTTKTYTQFNISNSWKDFIILLLIK
ncbi:MAG: hypothetical protein IPP52_16020 [Ignavibacteria bacterium]|nr:hypothetical protein [Ignavibacteria bacterium]